MKRTDYKNYPNPILEKSPPRSFTITHGDMKIPEALVIKKGTILSPGGNILYKSGKVYEAVTGQMSVKLYKDHSFGADDHFFDGPTDTEIQTIDKTNEDYDVITVDAVITLLAGEVVYSTASGAVASTGLAVVAEDVVYEKTTDTVSLAIADTALLELAKMPNYWAAAIETSDIKTI